MSDRQVIERVWDAPLALIWELWTTPDGVASWFGPRGFTVEVHELDPRVGGAFHYTMRATSPEAVATMEDKGRPTSWSVDATYTEMDAPHRLAYHSPMGGEKLITEVTFTEVDRGVKMELVIDATTPGMAPGAAMGWRSTLERFAERLASRWAEARGLG